MKLKKIILPSFFIVLSIFIGCNSSKKNTKTLQVKEEIIEVGGKKATIYSIVQPDGTYGLSLNKGDNFNIIVENNLPYPTSIHWHGLILPNSQDGVAGVTQLPIYPGVSYPYFFPIVQSGTYYMHSHFDMQEQKLCTAPLILNDPKEKMANQDVVLMLNDFTFSSAQSLFNALNCKKGKEKKPMSNMPDYNDVNYDAFLINHHTAENPEIIQVKQNTDVRLRIINASSSTNYFIDLKKLPGKLIAVDGHFIKPLEGTLFEIGIGQRMDIIVRIPESTMTFPILAQGEGTSMQAGVLLQPEGAKLVALSSAAAKQAKGFSYTQEENLKALQPLSSKSIDRSVVLNLGGNMQDYSWTINNQSWPNITPILVKKGERVEVKFNNNTTMAHPMHFHGHVFQVTNINGKEFSGALRDTVLVLPNSSVTIQFDATNPGTWVLHCHNLYHMKAGMVTLVRYSEDI